MLSTKPPTISPREVATVVVQESDWLSTLGDIAAVLAGFAAAAGLGFTGWQALVSNRRDAAREVGRARRVRMTIDWPAYGEHELPFIDETQPPWYSPEWPRWRFTPTVDVVNGNDTSITDLTLAWRTNSRHEAVVNVATWPSPTIVLPHERAPTLTANILIRIEKMPPPYNGWTTPWDVGRDAEDLAEVKAMARWMEASSEVQKLGCLYIRWEMDGVLWERDPSGVRRIGDAAS